MAWVSVHAQVRDHRKTRALFRSLEVSRAQAVGHLVLIWTWAIDNCDRDGKLLECTIDDVETAACWDGQPGELYKALVNHGWIDENGNEIFLHDWSDFNKEFYAYRDRLQRDRLRKKQGDSVEIPAEIPRSFQHSHKPLPAPLHKPLPAPLPEKENALCPASRTTQSTIREIVEFLNLTIGANFKPTSAKTIQHINARLREGYTVDDFKTVILRKFADWRSDPAMVKYLRPETLFGTKFEGYLNQPIPVAQNSFLDIAAREAPL